MEDQHYIIVIDYSVKQVLNPYILEPPKGSDPPFGKTARETLLAPHEFDIVICAFTENVIAHSTH